jgi:hypothetical protein
VKVTAVLGYYMVFPSDSKKAPSVKVLAGTVPQRGITRNLYLNHTEQLATIVEEV